MPTEITVVRGTWRYRSADGSNETLFELGAKHWRTYSAWINAQGLRDTSDNVFMFTDPAATFRQLRQEIVAELDSTWRDGRPRAFNCGPTMSDGRFSPNLAIPLDRARAESVLQFINTIHPLS